MREEQKKKVRELKQAILTQQDKIIAIVKEFDPVAIKDQPAEEQEKARKEHQTKIEIEKTHLQNMKEEHKLAKMNKLGSSFFEFIPTPPNRRFRKLARKFKLA